MHTMNLREVVTFSFFILLSPIDLKTLLDRLFSGKDVETEKLWQFEKLMEDLKLENKPSRRFITPLQVDELKQKEKETAESQGFKLTNVPLCDSQYLLTK